MQTKKRTFRLLLATMAVGLGLGAAAGMATGPLSAQEEEIEAEAGATGHLDWAGYWWCHCGGTKTCGPCSEHP